MQHPRLRKLPRPFASLSARLLLLTLAFVMLAEVLIYAPSIANFRVVFLEECLAAARLAAFAVEATPDHMVSRELTVELLNNVGAHIVVLHEADRRLLLASELPLEVDLEVKLDDTMPMRSIWEAFATLAQTENRILRVMGPSSMEPDVLVEVLMDEAPVRAAMLAHSRNILLLSLVISGITAALVFLALHWLMVRPLRRMTEDITAFADNPENATVGVRPSGRGDEIGVAEAVLSDMQAAIRASLKQREHLAALGSAVSKISHDLRGILSTAVLISDRLAAVEEPEVKRIAPRLIDSIDRAINLCAQTLNFARDEGPQIERASFALRGLVEEVAGDMAALAEPGGDPCSSPLVNEVAPDIEVSADRGQLYRVFSNLARNALEAGADQVRVAAANGDGRVSIDVSDDGPGLPPKARDKLFRPFTGSARQGGTGLGLVIARDVMRAHGGDIELVSSDAEGTVFRLDLPFDG